MNKMRRSVSSLVYMCNIVLPLFLGLLFYYLFCPDVMFVRVIDFVVGGGVHLSLTYGDGVLLRIIRNYLLDFLWSYSLTFSIFYLYGSNAADHRHFVFYVSFGLCAVMEILQCVSYVPGTFDVFDLFVEFLGTAAAVFIIRSCKNKTV